MLNSEALNKTVLDVLYYWS